MKLQIQCNSLDKLLNGGVEYSTITEFYGEAGTGKTNLCLQLSRNCVLEGKKVIFIDTEGVSMERLAQISGSNYENVFKNILFYQPFSLEEQERMVENGIKLALSEINIGLIALDSATNFYRAELLNGTEGNPIRKSLTNQITKLLGVSRKKNLPVVITNQVYTDIERKVLEPIGGQLLKYSAKIVIKLEKIGIGRRKATLIKHRSLPEGITAEFCLTDKGVE